MRISDWSSDVCSSDLKRTKPKNDKLNSQETECSVENVSCYSQRTHVDDESGYSRTHVDDEISYLPPAHSGDDETSYLSRTHSAGDESGYLSHIHSVDDESSYLSRTQSAGDETVCSLRMRDEDDTD